MDRINAPLPTRPPQMPVSEEVKAIRSIGLVLWLFFAILIVLPLAYWFTLGGLAAYDAHSVRWAQAARETERPLPCDFRHQYVVNNQWVCR